MPPPELPIPKASRSELLSAQSYSSFIFMTIKQICIYHITNVPLIPLLTNEDDRRQQEREPAANAISENGVESTACLGRRALDAQVSAIAVMRLEDRYLYTKLQALALCESGQWTGVRTCGNN
ncbi:Hypothetical_protein [Hexamita inflata]|uniref:Hypothetical_protein n=1 Tax=Hexamita inflata TaxID=28002 RepID=A0AA86NV07_9EUKA|nr:Hypothetical protein HINF_LOCUS13312 [Hexamita inflata]